MKNAIVRLENVKFGKMIPSDLLLNIEKLEIFEGEVTGITGAGGSGKSILLKIMALLEMDYEGELYVFGKEIIKNIDIALLREQISFISISEGPVLHDISVFDYVALEFRIRKYPEDEIKPKINKLLEKLYIRDFADKQVFILSGSEIQVVKLARVLCLRSKLLLLDEPFAKINYSLREKIIPNIKNIFKENKSTIVFAERNMMDSLLLCDRLITIEQGRVRQELLSS